MSWHRIAKGSTLWSSGAGIVFFFFFFFSHTLKRYQFLWFAWEIKKRLKVGSKQIIWDQNQYSFIWFSKMLLPRPLTHFYKYHFNPDLIKHFYIGGRKWEIQPFFGNVTSSSMCTIAGVKKYNIIIHLLIVTFMKRTLIISQINLINIKWIRPFKFVRLPTKFLSMYTFAKRGNLKNLQETDQSFPNTSEK